MKFPRPHTPAPAGTPYNDLPPLPPQTDVESKAVLKQCIKSRAALAELRAAGRLIPDQSVLISAIPLLEAKDSSAIENIVTTNDALFREASLMEAEGEPAAKEAIRYRSALFQGIETLKERPITTHMAVEICRRIKGIELDIRATPGTTLRNSITGEIIYTPPEGQDRLRGMLGDWEAFLNGPTEIDPLIKMALLHYQFEAIHPFIDGNGRTGRILSILMLIKAGLLDLPTLYLSRYILRHRNAYYDLLAGVTQEQAWEPWVLYMLVAVEESAGWTNKKIQAISRLMEHTAQHMRIVTPAIYSYDLVQSIFSQPYIRISHLVERGIAKRVAASRYLKQLGSVGVLTEEKVGRDKLFVHRKYMDLLASEGHDFTPYPSIAAP